jgi:hypothetical protein
MERDPRVTPEIGDVLRYAGGGPAIQVIGRDATAVSWTSERAPDSCCDIGSWQRWAKSATVVRRADPA